MNRVERLKGFRNMIARLAWQTWRQLPRQHQIWISTDDLIEDGMFKAYQVITSKWYDPNKSALSTTIYHVVQNHLFNEYIQRYGNEMRFASLESAGIIDYNQKRKNKQRGLTPAGVYSLDGLTATTEEKKYVIDSPHLSTSETTIYDNVLTDCFVVPTLVKIYNGSSHRLKEEMVAWFLQNRDKVHMDGKKFRRAVKEFRSLSGEYDLTYYDCLHLLRSAQCMNRLSIQILSVPYNLDFPTPAYEKLC